MIYVCVLLLITFMPGLLLEQGIRSRVARGFCERGYEEANTYPVVRVTPGEGYRVVTTLYLKKGE